MKKIDLGQTITIFANLGVIAGIIFLGFELRQNSQFMRAQTANDIARLEIELAEGLRRDDRYMQAVLPDRIANDPDSVEDIYVGNAFRITLRMLDNMFYQYRLGVYDKEPLDRSIRGIAPSLNVPINLDVYCSDFLRPSRSTGFFAYADELLDYPCQE